MPELAKNVTPRFGAPDRELLSMTMPNFSGTSNWTARLARVLLAVVSLALLGLPATTTAFPRWKDASIEPPPRMNQTPLYGISCNSLRACTASGQTFTATTWVPGAVAETFDGSWWANAEGVTWNPGRNNGILLGVSCTAATTCMTVGAYSEFGGSDAAMAQGQSGTRWTLWNVGIPAGSTRADLTAVSCTEANWCMAVGHKMISGDLKAMAIKYDGRSWTDTGASQQRNATLGGISCVSSRYCVAVGSTNGVPLGESWDGSRWTTLPTPPVPLRYESAILNAVSCVSREFCMAVGSDKLSGSNWDPFSSVYYGPEIGWNSARLYPGVPGKAQAWSVSCKSTTECWAVGDSFETIHEPWTSHWTGAEFNWESLEAPLSPGSEGAQLLGVSCTGRNECKAVGWNLFSGTKVALAETLTP
jgi:hypothetical protein